MLARGTGSAAVAAVVAGLATLLLVPRAARAEPWLAVKNGMKCSQCHVNVTGGGMRNEFGRIFSQTTLPTWTVSKEDLRAALGAAAAERVPDSTFLDPSIGPVSFGGNLRLDNRSTISKRRSVEDTNDFSIREGNLYVEARLLGDALAFYLDETVAPGGAASREAFGIARGLPLEGYVKAGRILLPYGLRVFDDESFIREATGFNYGVQDLGVEAGIEPGPISWSVALSNGTQGGADDNRDKAVSTVASLVFRHFRIGGSAAYARGDDVTRLVYGGFAGATWGRFTVLAEVDRIEDTFTSVRPEDGTNQVAALVELDAELYRGVNLKLQYDWLDPDTGKGKSENERARYGAGVEWFAVQFFETSLFYRFRDEPSRATLADAHEVTFEVHFFF